MHIIYMCIYIEFEVSNTCNGIIIDPCCLMISLQMQLSFSSQLYYPSAGCSVNVCIASATSELNVMSENQGGLYANN